MDKTCKTCRYHRHEDISDGYVCVNADSDKVADWTEDDYSCDKWEMYDCCQNCRFMLNGKKWKYLEDGSVFHEDLDGYICTALAFEDVAVNMIGEDPEHGYCEMHGRKDERTNEHI